MCILDMHMEPILCGGKGLLQKEVVITKNLLQVFTKWGSLKTAIYQMSICLYVYYYKWFETTTPIWEEQTFLPFWEFHSWPTGASVYAAKTVISSRVIVYIQYNTHRIPTDLTSGSSRWALMWEGGEADCSTASKQCSCEWPDRLHTPTHTVLV